MKLDRLAPLFAGILIGALLLSAAPVAAKKSGGPKALARKMATLEMRVAQLEESAAADAEAIDARLQELEKLTQLLDHDGSYVGYVDSVQVWSHYCTDGADAVWVDYEGYPELSCPATTASLARPSVRPRGEAIERLSKGGNRN